MDNKQHARQPERSESCWQDSVRQTRFDPLQEDIEVDVAVVGGGITGVVAAYLLVQDGLRVALLEADRLMNGTTGHTTAKLTAQHGLLYHELLQHMGKWKARLYYESHAEALQWVERTAKALQIDCQLQTEEAYVYAATAPYAKALEQEATAYQTLDIPGGLVDSIPFDLPIHGALRMDNQAQFHPLKFLASLVGVLQEQGCLIYEGTTAIDVEDGERPTVRTRNGHRVTARKVLSCSHFPFYDGLGFYFARMYAERAYVVAGPTAMPYPGGMYISADSPTRSLRSVEINGEAMVLFSGEGHKAGQGQDTRLHYDALRSFGESVLGLKEAAYQWSAQDLYTLDKVPYIGRLTGSHPNILVATGYKKWGMTTGIVAAHLLHDLVLDDPNDYEGLYAPSRFYVDPSLKTFFVENANVAAHLIKGKLEVPMRKADEVQAGEGAVVMYQGRRAGAYRDDSGTLYVVDTTCTHLGCEVTWNHGDRTWDCPCHGSRFTCTGEVMEGPAREPLKRLDNPNGEGNLE